VVLPDPLAPVISEPIPATQVKAQVLEQAVHGQSFHLHRETGGVWMLSKVRFPSPAPPRALLLPLPDQDSFPQQAPVRATLEALRHRSRPAANARRGSGAFAR